MQLSALSDQNDGGRFAALAFRVAGPHIPDSGGLRAEADSGVIRCTLAGAPILWARPDPCLQGIWVLQRNAAESPGILPPWRFPEARALRSADPATFLESWAKVIAEALVESPRSPLHQGNFLLSAARATQYGLEPVGQDHLPAAASGIAEIFDREQPEWLPWVPSFRVVLPLRERPRENDGRVKAWRKAVQEGWLPPLVLFWVSGLNAFLLLDGHARLVAMELEGSRPSHALILWRPIDVPNADGRCRDDAVRRYERASDRFAEWSEATVLQMNRGLVSTFSSSYRIARTVAVPVPNLHDNYQLEVSARLREVGKLESHPMLTGEPRSAT